jgi:hypothetical protein
VSRWFRPEAGNSLTLLCLSRRRGTNQDVLPDCQHDRPVFKNLQRVASDELSLRQDVLRDRRNALRVAKNRLHVSQTVLHETQSVPRVT